MVFFYKLFIPSLKNIYFINLKKISTCLFLPTNVNQWIRLKCLKIILHYIKHFANYVDNFCKTKYNCWYLFLFQLINKLTLLIMMKLF